MADVRIGISGWTYPPWRGVFYPDHLPHGQELAWASRQFPAIEINGTFYSLQRPSSYARWLDQTPEGFVFALKGGRFITHTKRLRDVRTPLANFFASGLLRLGRKLGPILWQLPPTLRFEPEALDRFLAMLPHDTRTALELARGHDERLAGRAWLEIDAVRPVRHALEVRHASFRDPKLLRLLRKYGVALVVADTAGKWPLLEDVTADFCYLRLHGDKILYESGYTSEALDFWAARIDAWRQGGEPADARRVVAKPGPKRPERDVFAFFDNDVKVRAPFDAEGLMRRLGLRWAQEEIAEARERFAREGGARQAPRDAGERGRRGGAAGESFTRSSAAVAGRKAR